MTKSVFFVLFCCMVAVLADQTPSCLQTTHETCHEYKQCCSRMCRGSHQATCTERGGEVSQASCRCEGSASQQHQDVDESAYCRLAADGSCSSFRSCCENRCGGRPARQTCSSHGNGLTESVCHCPPGSRAGSSGSGHFDANPRDGHGGSGSFDHHYTTPRYGHGGGGSHGGGSHSGGSHGGGSHGGLREHMGEEDYTNTCTRNHRDCTAFVTCCHDRCGERSVQSQCQESGGHLRNTLCKCGR